MKSSWLAMFAVVAIQTVANAASQPTILTRDEELRILSHIDDICGDTWCEGDFGFVFKDFSCWGALESSTCELDFVMSYDHLAKNHDTNGITYRQKYPVECIFDNLKREDVINPQGYHVYADSLYRKLTDCITELENLLVPLNNR